MASPRELELGVLSPLAPNFPRKLDGPTLTKFSGVEDLYEDVMRQPTEPAAQSKIKLTMDVPVTVRRARFTVEAATISVPNASEFGSTKLCDLPDRNILVLQCEADLTLMFSGDFAANDDGDFGIGTTAAAATPLGAASKNLGTTAIDNLSVTDASSVKQNLVGGSVADQANLLIPDAAGNAIYLNYSADTGQLAAEGIVTVNGTVDIWYIDLGNVGS